MTQNFLCSHITTSWISVTDFNNTYLQERKISDLCYKSCILWLNNSFHYYKQRLFNK